jgi:2-keto-4-pentenoate hydratase
MNKPSSLAVNSAPNPALNAAAAPAAALVAALVAAWRGGERPSAQIHTQAVPDAEAAFAIQQAVGEALGWWAPWEMPGVWKSGGPSRSAPMKHAGLPTPAVHQLRAGEVADLRAWPLHAPVLESEIALRLGHSVSLALAATLTPASASALVDAMAVAIEVVDSRWQERAQAPALLQLADGQWHGALLLGPWQPWPATHPWAEQLCELTLDGQTAARCTGTHPLGEPAWLLPVWLRHLTRHGASVPAGTIVTTGNWTGATPWPAGSTARAVFAGLGEVAVRR